MKDDVVLPYELALQLMDVLQRDATVLPPLYGRLARSETENQEWVELARRVTWAADARQRALEFLRIAMTAARERAAEGAA